MTRLTQMKIQSEILRLRQPIVNVKYSSSVMRFTLITHVCNKSFKNLTCAGKVQRYLESILFQRSDIYFCFSTSHVHPSIMN